MRDLPSWLQAFAAIVALGIATWTVRETKAAVERALEEAREREDHRDALRASMVAAAIVVELEILSGGISRTADRLFNVTRPIQLARSSYDQFSAEAYENLTTAVHDLPVDLPMMLKENLGRLHWLGEPAGQLMLIVVSMLFSLNSILSQMSSDVAAHGNQNLAGWLDLLKEHIEQLTVALRAAHTQVAAIHEPLRAGVPEEPPPWWTRPPR